MNRSARYVLSLAAILALVAAGPVTAAEAAEDELAFFEKRIRPMLVKHCYECHSAESKELGGKLLLDSRHGILEGGESGPALVAGKPEESLLIQALRFDDLEMPPDNPLPEAVVNDFVRWIAAGAVDPRTENAARAPEPAFDNDAFWSFRPRQKPPIPQIQSPGWPRDPLDHFVLSRIEAARLAPADDADPQTLARRLQYDLVGLPPTIGELKDFVAAYDRDPDGAIEHFVDQLLAMPQFGERWGRHWLDVARYGESNGDDGLGRNASFPHAWRYRDYVIESFNNDVPYDRFLREQIAGDLLPFEDAAQRNRQLVATGFLAIGAKPAAAMNKNFAMDIVDDQIDVVSTAVMGLSVACARCHDHKHDPIPTRDYYALAGIFASTETLYGRAANEKLTAPPTPLHELKDRYSADKDAASRLAFPEDYSQVIETLRPLAHERLDVAPTQLIVESGATFSKAEFATVNTASLHGQFPDAVDSYTVSFWFRNNTANLARPITAYLFSRGPLGDKPLPGDHLGIGGAHDKSRSGKLFVFNGNQTKQSIAGTTVIPPGSWNHVVLVRRGKRVQLFLNGRAKPEIDGELPPTFGDSPEFCLATRSDKFAPLDGNVAEFAIFDRAITEAEAQRLHAASGRPRGSGSTGFAMGVRDKPKTADCKIHINGESRKLGPLVPRGFLTAYDVVSQGADEAGERSPVKLKAGQSGRLELANWLTRAEHPQTARVLVNRIWLHLMGRGIVTTPDDFGVYGARPSHPALLDHLAQRLIDEGWSIKNLIRAIVLSRTYRLDSHCSEELAAADPDNRWFARHQRRRLDAEALRDSILQASGQLDRSPGIGSAVEDIDTLINWPPGEATNLHRPSNRRSVYLCLLRHAPPPELAVFDLPDGLGVTGQRAETTLPTQALFLFNAPFIVRQAEALAKELLAAEFETDEQRVTEMFRRVLVRDPSADEVRRSVDLVAEVQQELAAQESLGQENAGPAAENPTELPTNSAESRRLKGWASLAQALFTTSEFRYID